MLAIDSRWRDALVEYLKTRPWIEVNQVLPVLMNLEPVPKKEDE